ncbi:hypothetical protein [Changchengzhania lutea]|uniref:hypothetical protein n=1 Tax=Changchengzhania lutea TaxID=2049305 RepID=UPI00115ED7B2|nr:hypothetical protein [Changchengzhania lutea]
MKKITCILIFLLTFMTVSGQNRDNKRNAIKALKVSFITERLDLSVNEAEKFWPVYNAYEDESLKIKHEDLRHTRREIKETYQTINDERAQELLDKLIASENALHNLKNQLIDDLKQVISPQKIILLKVAEEEFNRKLFERLKKRRQEFRNKD